MKWMMTVFLLAEADEMKTVHIKIDDRMRKGPIMHCVCKFLKSGTVLTFLFGSILTIGVTPVIAEPGKKSLEHGGSKHPAQSSESKSGQRGSHSGHAGGHTMPDGMQMSGSMHDMHKMHGGMPGDAANVTRTILIVARDTEFNLKKVQVKAGETIRFIVKNKGDLVHEFTIGTPEMQKAH